MRKLFSLLTAILFAGSMMAGVESVDFSAQGYENQQAIESYTGTNFTVTFDKGTNSNAPKYYTSGAAIRCYGANTFTVASTKTIIKIVLTYGASDGSNEITAAPGTFATDTWTGSANSVVFTIGGTSGNRRIKAIEVTFDGEGGGDTPGGDTPGGGTPEVTDPTNCAEAATAALSVSANNEEYNGGKSYTIQGYVTEIAFAYDATKGNMSFWMADTKDGGKVLEAYKCTITSAENAPAVGDKVAVTGKLTKFNTTPEFAAGCTVAIIEKAGGDTPGGDTPGGDTPASGDAESVDFSAQGYENQQAIESYTGTNFTVTFDKGTNNNAPKYYTSGTAIRCYGANTFTVASTKTIIKIVLTYGASDGSNDITAAPGTFTTDTWTGSANSVVFTIGGTSGNRRIKAIEVTFDGGGVDPVTPPVEMTDAEKLEAYIALLGDVKTYVAQFAGLEVGAEDFANQVDQLILFGNQALSSGDATKISTAVSTAEGLISSKINDLLTTGKQGLAKQLDNLLDNAQGCEACVTIVNTLKQTVQGLAWDSNKSNEENLANLVNQTEQILKDAQQQIEAALNPGTTTDPTNCAEAAAAALSVSANNELYNNGAEYTIEGYVTGIKTAYNSQFNNISFWMADTKEGGEVLQAYRAACASEADAPGVGDKVKVTGKLTKYGTTPEFAAGCTFVIVEKATGGDTPAVTDPTNCAEAAAAALSVSGNNVPYNDSTIYTIKGYVTSIQTAYNPSFGNISFWMADTKDGGNVIEPYRCVPESAEQIPAVGDYVEVTGALSKYKSNPQFMAGCTCRILEKDIPAANLGEKTIAEFLALKNIKDTCVLTGIVANIKKNEDGSYNKYGNFDLVELGNDEVSVYIYGLLTADGQAQKFQEMGVDESDTLVIKAIYSEHNGTPQVANAIFVEVRKAAAAEWEPWDFVKTQYIAYEGDGYIDINLFTNDSYYIEINEEGGQDVYGEGDCTILTLDLAYTDLDDLTGSYSNDNQTLDLEYTGAVTFVGDEEAGTTLSFTSGLVTISWNENHDGYVLVYNLTDTYGRFCSDTLDIPLYGDAPSGDNVQIYVDDATWDADDQGYWMIFGQTDSYIVGLANLTAVEEVDGTYTVAELDPDYSYIYDADMNKITLVSGSIEVYTEDGSVYVEGTVVGSDGVTYELSLAYEAVQPTGEEVTITASGDNVAYADNVASQGWWIIQGRNADYTVQLSNYYTISQAAGTYDNAELDPDYSWVVYNQDTLGFVSGSITLAEDRGAIILTGSLLGQDGTLYILNFMYGEPVDPTGQEVTITAEGDNVAYRDAVASSGWWILSGHNDTYTVQLSNLNDIEQAAGTYDNAELDPDYSWVAYNQDTLGFVSGAITLVEYPRGVMVTGSLLAKDGVTYNLKLIYGDTTAVDPSLGERINVTMTSGLQWQDNTGVVGARWWALAGQNDAYYITLSNLDSAYTAAGTYTWEQMDKTYSYIVDMSDNTQIAFYSGTIEVAVDEFGKVTITGELVAVNNNTYVLNLQYVDPKPETTVTVSIPEGEVFDYTSFASLFGFSGATADSTIAVQLNFDGETVAGSYTEQDFDYRYAEVMGYSSLYVKNAAGAWESVSIYSATITIVDGGNGAYTLTGDVLCYNNTLYKVTLIVPAVDPYEYDEASDFTATFSTYTVDESRLASMGSVYVIGQNEQGQVIMMDVILSGTATGLEPGTYSIDNTEEMQTVYAGHYDAEEGPVPSYAGLVSSQGLTNVWYLVSGTVIVDENLNIVVNALNSKGNAITVALTAPEKPTGLEETVAAGKAAKILRNGQIYILKGDKIFNIMGAAIR